MLGIELVQDRDAKQPFDAAIGLGNKVCQRGIEKGVWIRPLSDVIILMPPLVAGDEEIDLLATVVCEAITEVTNETKAFNPVS